MRNGRTVDREKPAWVYGRQAIHSLIAIETSSLDARAEARRLSLPDRQERRPSEPLRPRRLFFAACPLGDSSIAHAGASPSPSMTANMALPAALRRMDMNTLVSVSVFGLVPIPPMSDTLSTWSRPSKMVAKLHKEIEPHGLEGIISKRQASACRSGPPRDWVKIKTAAWRVVGQFENRR